MPDFCMCSGVGCPAKMRKSCVRANATPTSYTDENGNRREHQSYFAKPPVLVPKNYRGSLTTIPLRHAACSYYWPDSDTMYGAKEQT